MISDHINFGFDWLWLFDRTKRTFQLTLFHENKITVYHGSEHNMQIVEKSFQSSSFNQSIRKACKLEQFKLEFTIYQQYWFRQLNEWEYNFARTILQTNCRTQGLKMSFLWIFGNKKQTFKEQTWTPFQLVRNSCLSLPFVSASYLRKWYEPCLCANRYQR